MSATCASMYSMQRRREAGEAAASTMSTGAIAITRNPFAGTRASADGLANSSVRRTPNTALPHRAFSSARSRRRRASVERASSSTTTRPCVTRSSRQSPPARDAVRAHVRRLGAALGEHGVLQPVRQQRVERNHRSTPRACGRRGSCSACRSRARGSSPTRRRRIPASRGARRPLPAGGAAPHRRAPRGRGSPPRSPGPREDPADRRTARAGSGGSPGSR